jgi:hypothetical protein|tara:strand:+ start:316 stop:774 length:459 start_codon:yes stop_codon:yes gene_type:complete
MAATYATLADPVSAVVDLLDDNWSAVASSVGTTPTIDESWDIGKKNLKNGDIIRCYETASNHEFLGIGKGIDKHNATITIDISTANSRERLRKLYQGVVHIIHAAHSKSAGTALNTDYASIKLLSRTDQSDKNRRWYRYVLNCEITSYEVVN